MTAVLKLFWGICLLRHGPEAVPTHNWFVWSLAAAELAFSVFLLNVVSPGLAPMLAFNLALLNLAVVASIIWFALYIRRLEARFPATLGAVLGTGLLINAAFLVGYGITSGVVQQGWYWLCHAWGIAVAGFILHRALACKLWAGILLSLAIALVSLVVAQATLGPALAASLSAASE